MYVLDPAAMDNALNFQNSYYPGNVEVMNPGASFKVGVKQISGYAQMDFHGDFFGIPFSGNGGVKVINTSLISRSTSPAARSLMGWPTRWPDRWKPSETSPTSCLRSTWHSMSPTTSSCASPSPRL